MHLLLVLVALAATPTHPVTLEGGLSEFAGTDGAFGGGLYGRIGVHAGQFSADLGVREGYLFVAERTVGSIFLGGRYALRDGPYFRAAFLHHHETPIELAKRFPVQSTLGSLSGIHHRSGLELGIGADIPVLQQGYQQRLGINLDVAVGAFPDDGGSSVYVFVQQGFTLDVGKRRGSAGAVTPDLPQNAD